IRRLVLAIALTAALLMLGSAAASANQFAGVNDHLLRSDMYPRRYPKLKSAAMLGAKVDRIDLRWQQLEPAREGGYDSAYLAQIDSVVALAHSVGIKPLFTVLGTPCWASSAPVVVKLGCPSGVGWNAYPPSS